MNRVIKFRGKRIGDIWHFGDLEFNPSQNVARIHSYNDNGEYLGQHIVDPDTIGQFTGLYDKNGKEIYEGDIVRVDISRCDHRIKNRQYMNDKVEWYQYKFILSKADINVNTTYRIEVIGNIHDNPELLKGGEK